MHLCRSLFPLLGMLLCVVLVAACDEGPPAASGAPATVALPPSAPAPTAEGAGGAASPPATTSSAAGDTRPVVTGSAAASAPPPPPEPSAAGKPPATPPPATPPPATTPPATTGAPPRPPVTVAPPPPAPPPVAPPALPPVGPAEPGTADDVAAKIDAIYKPIAIFRARFDQQYKVKISGATKRSSGVVIVKRPRKLSFRYHEPNQNRVVSDGSKVKVYEHDNQQMFVQDVEGTDYPGALAFIMGKGLRESFTFTFHASAKFEGGRVLVGKPRRPNAAYEHVLFYVDDKALEEGSASAIRRVLVIDATGNQNRFDFLNVSQPESIGDAEFVFEPPPGTTLVNP